MLIIKSTIISFQRVEYLVSDYCHDFVIVIYQIIYRKHGIGFVFDGKL